MDSKYSMTCIAGFVISLASLLINFFGLVGIIGLVVSILGLVQVNRDGGKGKGMAIAGICVGGFSVLWALLSLAAL